MQPGGGGGQPPPPGLVRMEDTVQSLPRRMRAEIFGIPWFLRPLRVAAPLEMAARHVPAVAHSEEQRALRSVDVFVEFAGRMNHESARHDVDRLLWRAHLPATLETEVNLGRVRMTMIGADLPRLPACDRDVALADLAEHLLHVTFGIPLLLREQIENLHALTSDRALWQPRDDPHVAIGRVVENLQRVLVSLTVVRGDRGGDAVEFDDHDALLDPSLERFRRHVARQKTSAGSGDCRPRELGVSVHIGLIFYRTIARDPIRFGHCHFLPGCARPRGKNGSLADCG